MNRTTIRKSVNEVKAGELFISPVNHTVREIVRVREVVFEVSEGDVPGVEILHKSPAHPHVQYSNFAGGGQLSILIT